jgi:16S rRNA (adenine1518-N6/adenine1519-N6)-dimethyltransferase
MDRMFADPAALMDRHGLSAKKSLGQNFLTDGVVARAVLEALPSDPGAIVEIGAGPGTMTRALAQSRQRVAAVELDQRLLPVLRREFVGQRNVEVVEGDALDLDLASLLPGWCSSRSPIASAQTPAAGAWPPWRFARWPMPRS